MSGPMVETTANGAGRPSTGGWSLRAHLIGIAGIVLVLTGAVGTGLTGRAYAGARHRAVAGVRNTAGEVARAIDHDLGQALELMVASAPGIAATLDQAAAVTAPPELCSLSFTGVGVFSS